MSSKKWLDRRIGRGFFDLGEIDTKRQVKCDLRYGRTRGFDVLEDLFNFNLSVIDVDV